MIPMMFILFLGFDEPRLLRYQFKPREQFSYTSKQSRKTSISVQTRTFTFDTEQDMDVTWHVKEIGSDGVIKLSQVIDRLHLTLKGGPVGNITVDTTKENNLPRVQPLLDVLKKHEFAFLMKPDGNTSTAGKEGELLRKLNLKEDDAVLKQMASSLESSVFQPTLLLPEKPIKPGEGWDLKPYTYKHGDNWITADTRIEFVGVVRREGAKRLEFQRKTTWSARSTKDDGKAPEMKIVSQTSSGTIWLDTETRRLVESNWEEKITTATGQGTKRINYVTETSGEIKLRPKTENETQKDNQ